MRIGTSGLRGKGMKLSTFGLEGQSHTRPMVDLEAWLRHQPTGRVAF